MRDLLFKNLTSTAKKRRCLSLLETVTQDGVLAKSKRHVIYSVEETQDTNKPLERPVLSIIRLHNSQDRADKLFCKMKGKLYVVSEGKFYLVSFIHTLRVELNESER